MTSPQTEQRELTAERRKIVRKAFDIVRNDPARLHLRKEFAASLGGKRPLDAYATELARSVIRGDALTSQDGSGQ